jgi:CubicO group peptidase (beta-lactamase class C family)
MGRHAIIVVAVLAATSPEATQGTPRPADVADLIAAELKAARVPGAGIAVVSGDQMLARGYGVRNTET